MTATEPITTARAVPPTGVEATSNSYAVPKLAVDWLLFTGGVALLVFCAFFIKDMTDWQDRLGGFVPAFLVLFVIMVIAGKLLLPRVDKATAWTRATITGSKG